jgi:hypothetical protein
MNSFVDPHLVCPAAWLLHQERNPRSEIAVTAVVEVVIGRDARSGSVINWSNCHTQIYTAAIFACSATRTRLLGLLASLETLIKRNPVHLQACCCSLQSLEKLK